MALTPYSNGMVEESKKPHDRYHISGNVEAQYVDAAGLVLCNKLGIADLATLQIAEEQSLAIAYRDLLSEVRTDTPLTCDLLRYVHATIFGGLYQWAGCWRTVWISKPGVTWPAPDFLDANMRDYERNVLRKHPATNLGEEHDFCAAVAQIQGEFLVIHPFREGNARAIKLASDLLAAQTGRPLLAYDRSDDGQRRYTEAARAAFKRDHAPMTEIIRQALAQAQNRP
jgi:cell filamentation protein